MSSRALRKLKREEEEARQRAALQAEHEEEDEADEIGQDTHTTKWKTKPVSNAFDMLGGADESDDSDAGEVDGEADAETNNVAQTIASSSTAPKPTKGKKKKK